MCIYSQWHVILPFALLYTRCPPSSCSSGVINLVIFTSTGRAVGCSSILSSSIDRATNQMASYLPTNQSAGQPSGFGWSIFFEYLRTYIIYRDAIFVHTVVLIYLVSTAFPRLLRSSCWPRMGPISINAKSELPFLDNFLIVPVAF